jgi:hypothetical protein
MWIILAAFFVQDLASAVTRDGADTRGGPHEGIVDIITGNVYVVQQQGRSGSRVGISVGTTACNKGTVAADWQMLPATNHPVIAQNLYRLKNDRFEQLGHSWVKHGFGVFANDLCNYGCTPGCASNLLCGGCSDSYNAQLNGTQTAIGSRAWVQPFTGFFISGSNRHAGHAHDGVSHRIIVEDAELAQDQNGNDTAQYFAEGQYILWQEFTHPDSRAAQAMMNNVTHRAVAVSGTAGGTYAFTLLGGPMQEQPAIFAWEGAGFSEIIPAPDEDGRAWLACKVTVAGAGFWRYEYAVYNENLDRAVGGLRIPIVPGTIVGTVGFSAPQNHPGWTDDGTNDSAGFSNAAWAATVSADAIEWQTAAFADDPNANAVRWGTLYNFWFFAKAPPRAANASVGFFKTADDELVATSVPGERCVGDVDQDGDVDVQDLAFVLSEFGTNCGINGCQYADIDGDGDADLQDLSLLLSNFGRPCP